MHSIFQISISRNTICAEMVDFRKSGHIYITLVPVISVTCRNLTIYSKEPHNQGRSQGWARQGPDPPKCLLCSANENWVSRILGNGNGKREREAGTGKVEICFKRSIPHLFTIHIELNS